MAKAKKAVRKKAVPKVKVEAIKKADAIEYDHVAVKPEFETEPHFPTFKTEGIKKAVDDMAIQAVVDAATAKLEKDFLIDSKDPSLQIEIPSVNTATKPITLAGKTVSISATGKVMLFNPKINKIITGLIDVNLAKKIIADFPHIEIMKNGKRD